LEQTEAGEAAEEEVDDVVDAVGDEETCFWA
jgi:hypothetical protein